MKFSSRSRKPALNITTSRARRQSRPRNRKRKLRRASCSSMPNRKSPTTPKTASTSFASRRPPAKILLQRSFKQLATPHGRPSHALYENTPKWVCSKSNFIFPKSNFTIQRSYPPVLQETRGYDSPINWGEIFYRARFALRKFTGLPL